MKLQIVRTALGCLMFEPNRFLAFRFLVLSIYWTLASCLQSLADSLCFQRFFILGLIRNFIMNFSEALNKTPIVIDNGSGFMKAGFSQNQKPKAVFQSIVGKPKYKIVLQTSSQTDNYVGQAISSQLRGVLKLNYPISHGIIQNWKDMDLLWQHVYSELKANPKEYPVLLTQANLNPISNRMDMCKHFFQQYSVPALFVAVQGILSLFATGKTTGMAIDSGDGVTHVVPVYEGYCLQHACQRMDIGGRDVTQHLLNLLRKSGHRFTTSIVREMKEKKCSVNMLMIGQRQDDKKKQSKDKYILPDNTTIQISTERTAAPELMFAPDKAGYECPSLTEIIFNSFSKVDMDIRKALYGDIVLAGGNTMIQNFPERLVSELKKRDMRARMYAPNVNRNTMCWSGGANISNLSYFKNMWITKKEFEEEGVRVIMRKTL